MYRGKKASSGVISLLIPFLSLLFANENVKLASLSLCLCLFFCHRNAEIINASYCMGAFTRLLSIQTSVLMLMKQALSSRNHLPVSEFIFWYQHCVSMDLVWLLSSLKNTGLAKAHNVHNGISDNRIGIHRETSRRFNFFTFNESPQCIN